MVVCHHPCQTSLWRERPKDQMDVSMNNLAVIQEYLRLAKLGERKQGTALFHKDFSVVEAEGLPYAGTYHGGEGFLSLIGKVMAQWSELEIETLQMIGAPEGEAFAIEMSMKGVSTKSGKPFSTRVCEIWTVKDGMIFSIRPYYWDTKALADIA